MSWSSDTAKNSVEAQYIIEEKAPGIRLGSLWNQWPRELKLQLITQVVDMENKLLMANVRFNKQGCIYFKEGLRSLAREAEDIHAQDIDSDVFDRFSIGPLTTNELWSRTRRSMKLDRGPCKYVNYRISILLFLMFLLSCAGKDAFEYTGTIG